MSDESFKALCVFCFSVICFGLGTGIAAFSDSDSVFFIAWLIGTITFGIAMVVKFG